MAGGQRHLMTYVMTFTLNADTPVVSA
jgi:hypothetical protein